MEAAGAGVLAEDPGDAACPPAAAPAHGNCLGSRSFYLALYKQMSFLEKRGCPRTALEYCKLILR